MAEEIKGGSVENEVEDEPDFSEFDDETKKELEKAIEDAYLVKLSETDPEYPKIRDFNSAEIDFSNAEFDFSAEKDLHDSLEEQGYDPGKAIKLSNQKTWTTDVVIPSKTDQINLIIKTKVAFNDNEGIMLCVKRALEKDSGLGKSGAEIGQSSSVAENTEQDLKKTEEQHLELEKKNKTKFYASGGARILDSDGKVKEGWETAEKIRKQERARALEIPSDIKGGSSEMTFYGLRNSIFINRETLQKREQEGSSNSKLLELEKSILGSSSANKFIEDAIKEESGIAGEELTGEQMQERVRDFPASQMYDYVQGFIDSLEKSKKDERVKDLLKAASSLQNKLMDEASKSKEKNNLN